MNKGERHAIKVVLSRITAIIAHDINPHPTPAHMANLRFALRTAETELKTLLSSDEAAKVYPVFRSITGS